MAVLNYQRVNPINIPLNQHFPIYGFPMVFLWYSAAGALASALSEMGEELCLEVRMDVDLQDKGLSKTMDLHI